MKLKKIIVDKLPNSCNECDFKYDRYYCSLKGSFHGESYVNRNSDNRDDFCPLMEEK